MLAHELRQNIRSLHMQQPLDLVLLKRLNTNVYITGAKQTSPWQRY